MIIFLKYLKGYQKPKDIYKELWASLINIELNKIIIRNFISPGISVK